MKKLLPPEIFINSKPEHLETKRVGQRSRSLKCAVLDLLNFWIHKLMQGQNRSEIGQQCVTVTPEQVLMNKDLVVEAHNGAPEARPKQQWTLGKVYRSFSYWWSSAILIFAIAVLYYGKFVFLQNYFARCL